MLLTFLTAKLPNRACSKWAALRSDEACCGAARKTTFAAGGASAARGALVAVPFRLDYQCPIAR